MKAGNVSFDLKRFAGIKRDYSKEDVEKLKGTFNIEYTLCRSQSEKLWNLLNTEPYVNTLGSLSGNQAVQHAKAGLKAIYLSGWQVAADANSAGEMYPDQSLYPFDSAPKLVDSMNNALVRADQIQHMEIKDGVVQVTTLKQNAKNMENQEVSTRVVEPLNLPNLQNEGQRIVSLLESKKLKFPPVINRAIEKANDD